MARSSRTRRWQSEDGVAATIVVIVFSTFAFGLAAVAVDLSAGFEEARSQQTIVDMACMAGIQELPEQTTAGVQLAAANLTANVAAFSGANPNTAAANVDWVSPNGEWTALITTPVDGDNTKMRVTVRRAIDTSFARLIGFDQIPVSQTATCGVFTPAAGDLPMGVLPGDTFDGVIKAETCGQQDTGGGNQGGGNQGGGNQGGGNQGGGGGPGNPGNQTGNCQYLSFPRLDGRTRELETNISEGVDRDLQPYGGTRLYCGTNSPCNTASTTTGSVVGQLTTGIAGGSPNNVAGRLTQFLGPFPFRPHQNMNLLNGDTWALATNPSSPAYNLELSGNTTTRNWPGYGQIDLPEVTRINNCSHPRLARVPVVVRESDLAADWPPGTSGDMRILGFYDVWIDDIQGSGSNLSVVEGRAFDASNATCVGPDGGVLPYDPAGAKLARLIAN